MYIVSCKEGINNDRGQQHPGLSVILIQSELIFGLLFCLFLTILKLFSNFSRPNIETTGKLPVENQHVRVS